MEHDGPGLGPGPLQDTDLIDDLLALITSVTDRARAAIADDLADDLVSQAVLIDITAALDKQSWMLAAQR